MTRDEFINLLSKNFEINDYMLKQIETYKSYLQEQNKIHNLTRLDSDDKIYEEYFYDSIIPYKDFKFNNEKILDIGSGSGVPGILLKIFFPNIKLAIIDSNLKKINFLKKLASKLNFSDIEFLNQRAENISSNQREKYDYVTSRAVASLKILIEISVPYLKVGGILIEPKSLNYYNELNESKEIIEKINIKLISVNPISTNKSHYVFIFKKEKETDYTYPRAWKEIIK